MRFPEFTSEWKKYKADTLFNFFSTNSLSWSELTYVSGNTKNYHYGLIHRGLPILTDVNDDRIPFLINDEDRKNKEFVRKGDLIFADASEDYSGVGQAIEIISDSIPAVAGLHTIHAREKKNLMELGFKGFLFNSTQIKDQLRRLAVGTKVYGISSKHFKDVNVNIPQDKNEQNKISLFLSAIEKKIETQRKLINNYETLMNEIYNCSEKESEYVLKDLVTFEKKTRRMSSEGRDSGIFAFYTNEKKQNKYIDDYDFNGEYIIANTGGQANFKYVNGAFAVMSDSLVMKIKEANTPAVYYSLLSMTQYINNVGFVGSGLKHLDKKWFSNLLIDIPNKKTIELLEKIEHNLQILKKFESNFLTLKIYLLQALFV